MSVQDIVALATAILSIVGGVNAWFISRMVGKLDDQMRIVSDLRTSYQNLAEKVKELSDLSSRVTSIEKQNAVLEFILRDRVSVRTEPPA